MNTTETSNNKSHLYIYIYIHLYQQTKKETYIYKLIYIYIYILELNKLTSGDKVEIEAKGKKKAVRNIFVLEVLVQFILSQGGVPTLVKHIKYAEYPPGPHSLRCSARAQRPGWAATALQARDHIPWLKVKTPCPSPSGEVSQKVFTKQY